MIALASYAGFCILLAFLNAYLIKKGRRIYHAINGALHLLAASAIGYYYGWELGVATLFVVRVFFDWSLNIFRGLPLGYVSLKPKSIVDKIEKFIFKMNGILPKIIYIAIIAALITYHVVH